MAVQFAKDWGALLGGGRVLFGVGDGYQDHLLPYPQANMQLRHLEYTLMFEDNTASIEWANHVIGNVIVPSTLISVSILPMRLSRMATCTCSSLVQDPDEVPADRGGAAGASVRAVPSWTLERCGRLRDLDPRKGERLICE